MEAAELYARKFVVCDPEKCDGCRICELICSFEKAKMFSGHKSRIRVARIHPPYNIAVSCLLCEDTPCVTACPSRALTQSLETGVVDVKKELCVRCGWCIQACKWGAVSFDLDEKVVVVCDLCGGDPKCIKWCPQKAIELNTKHVMKELALKHAAKRDIIELEIGVQGIRR